jgi:hypothetical protein
MLRWLAGLVFCAFAVAPAFAQDKEMIVVTGAKIQQDSDEAQSARVPGGFFSAPPYVSIIVPADYVIFTVSLETGTRSVDERERELERTFAALSTRVSRAQGVVMEVGEPGDSAPQETATAKEAIVDDGDRSFIPIVLKFSVREGDTFSAVRQRAETFIEGIQMTGRAEAVTGDLQYIGVMEPKKHREALLRKIAEDTRLLQSIFTGPGGAPAMSLTGLEGRVRNRPSGPLEMEMYIPYAIVLGSPQALR